MRMFRCLALVALSLLCGLLPGICYAQRVLVVTTDQFDTPYIPGVQNGCYAFTDLTAAGLPFDVRTYSRFMTMDMTPYDVIILSGYTTPTPVSQVADRCVALMSGGKKIFINGCMPFGCYNASGTAYTEFLYYVDRLFGVSAGWSGNITGAAVVPHGIEKDPDITAIGVSNTYIRSFNMPTPAPPMQITIGGKVVGFAGPKGGALRGYSEYEFNLIDYGKLVNFIRNGDATIVGFANDRLRGKPIAAFHTDCHDPSTTVSVDALTALSARYNIPVTHTLVYSAINSTGIAKWNSIAANPLVGIGSHTRTHPSDWPSVTNLASETSQAILDERVLIPATLNFLSFSGSKNPTDSQLDWLYQNNVLFDGQGQGGRKVRWQDGAYRDYQLMPINNDWLKYLSRAQYCPTWPSETLSDDMSAYVSTVDYSDRIATQFQQNIKYGMYSYGFFHDTFLSPTSYRSYNGKPTGYYIDKSMKYLYDNGAQFMFAHELIPRLQDYEAGNISYVNNLDGSITISAHRPNHLINEIKVGFKGDLTPVAVAGPSVVAQRLGGECAYIEMPAEVDSAVQVQWSLLPPVAPTVTYTSPYISDQSMVTWVENTHPSGIAEYQYAVGLTPGSASVRNWTSTGTSTSGQLAAANLQNGGDYYVSVRARYVGTGWSPAGVGGPYVADMTPPSKPVVVDGGISQASTTSLSAHWSSNDPETGVVEYMYAIGARLGDNSVRDWTTTTATDMSVTGLDLQGGQSYYTSVKARNGVGIWSSVGASDGIMIVTPTIRPTIGVARQDADPVHVVLDGNIVTAKFNGEFYIESADRSAGIRVESDQTVDLDQEVTIDGYTGQDGYERVIMNIAPIVIMGIGHIKPVLFKNSELGGSNDPVVYGPSGGNGLNNVGLLVKTFGKITNVGATYIDIDDGSAVPGVASQVGVRVTVSSPHSFARNSYIFVTGISTLIPDGSNLRRSIRTRSNSDVVVVH